MTINSLILSCYLIIYLRKEAGKIKTLTSHIELSDQESLFSNVILKGLIVLTLILPYPAGIDFSSSTKKILIASALSS